ncbi:hypothetical protein ABPG72_022697 [Tetrahymena utriculariae]
MAYVTDVHDPSGLGMFSKAGRFTSEKYIIFQRKDEILYNKKRVLKVSSYPSLGFENKVNEFDKKKQDDSKKDEDDKDKNKKEGNQPFDKQLSRERLNQIKGIKNPPKPVGYYHPRYTVLEKSPSLVWNILEVYKKQYQKPISKRPEVTYEELTQSIPEKLPQKVQGLIEYGRSLGRGDTLMNQKGNPHENRFETIHLSQTWSNMKRVPSFNMRKTIGREDNKIYENKEFAPDYHPNYEFGKKGLGTSGPLFHKIPSRKPFHKAALTHNENFYDFDNYKTKSVIFRNTTCPDFKRQLPRERDPNSPLPSFMQKFVNSRTQLVSLSHKMLEENNYMEGRFQSTESQFKSAPKTKPKQDDEESQDSIVYDNQN